MSNMISYRTRTPSLFPETRFFEDFMRPFFAASPVSSFRVDVKDEGDKFVLEAELPGVNRDSIVVDVNDGVLSIEAMWNENKKEDENGYVISERRSGSVKRSFNVENIEEGLITARYENGVLTLDLPKIQPEKKEPRKIDIL